jgi:uncharacterized membrane protein (UPF0127 family)
LVVGGWGCDRGQTRDDGDDETTIERDTERRNRDPTEDLEDDVGEACETDTDCSGYLKCRDKACEVPPAMTGESDEETPVVTFHEGDGENPVAEFHVEMATTPEARRTGLMYRPSMEQDWGMLFVYPEEQPRSFWMKNTRIPLDMVFVDAEGTVVSIVESAEPETLTPRRSEGPARFVLELNGGVAGESGIEPGQSMSVAHVPDKYRPRQ